MLHRTSRLFIRHQIAPINSIRAPCLPLTAIADAENVIAQAVAWIRNAA
jgi:hypothetical protein